VFTETAAGFRGGDLLVAKCVAIERLARRGIPITLVMTAAMGVSDHEAALDLRPAAPNLLPN